MYTQWVGMRSDLRATNTPGWYQTWCLGAYFIWIQWWIDKRTAVYRVWSLFVHEYVTYTMLYTAPVSIVYIYIYASLVAADARDCCCRSGVYLLQGRSVMLLYPGDNRPVSLNQSSTITASWLFVEREHFSFFFYSQLGLPVDRSTFSAVLTHTAVRRSLPVLCERKRRYMTRSIRSAFLYVAFTMVHGICPHKLWSGRATGDTTKRWINFLKEKIKIKVKEKEQEKKGSNGHWASYCARPETYEEKGDNNNKKKSPAGGCFNHNFPTRKRDIMYTYIIIA